MVDTPKVGSDQAGPVRAEMSGDAADGWSNWIGATPACAGVPLGLAMA